MIWPFSWGSNLFSTQSHEETPPQAPVMESGAIGNRFLAKNVRVLFLNGCAYDENDSRKAARTISDLFESTVGRNVCVHYLYIHMTFANVMRAIWRNEDPPGSEALVTNIRHHLAKICPKSHRARLPRKTSTVANKCLKGNGRLVIFLHSGAGAFLKSALPHLTLKERRKIEVISFNSAWLFQKENFRSVRNFVAWWDPFSLVARFLSGQRRDSSTPIQTAGSVWNCPLLSHKFLELPCQEALRRIVENYAQRLQAFNS